MGDWRLSESGVLSKIIERQCEEKLSENTPTLFVMPLSFGINHTSQSLK